MLFSGGGDKGRPKMDQGINITQHSSLGLLWFIGWLFSIGFLKLGFWKGALAFLIWPYMIGAHFAG